MPVRDTHLGCTPGMHAYKMHAYKMYAYKMHAYKMNAYKYVHL
jgi:hypothetical protein